MAKIVLSDQGYWIGKELYNGQKYYSSDEKRYTHPNKNLKEVTLEELSMDIENTLRVSVSEDTPQKVIKLLSKELCHCHYGMLYAYDFQSNPYGVRKIIGKPTPY